MRARRHGGRSGRWFGALVALVAVVGLALAPPALADGGGSGGGLGHYAQRNLVSDSPGAAELSDPNLVNAWGLSFGPTTPAWVADNGTDVSTLYSGGGRRHAGREGPADGLDPRRRADRHRLQRRDRLRRALRHELRARRASCSPRRRGRSRAGTRPSRRRRTSTARPDRGHRAGRDLQGPRDRRHRRPARGCTRPTSTTPRSTCGTQNFAPSRRPARSSDPALPAGFAPFGIQAINGGDRRHLRQAGRRRRGRRGRRRPRLRRRLRHQRRLLRRFAARGPLNAPWGIALAPQGFGGASGALLIGNFGDGRINAYDPVGGRFLGALRGEHGASRSRSTACGRSSSATA